MKKLLFIYNPKSGKGKIRAKLSDILDVFARAGYDTIAHPTTAPGDGGRALTALAGEADRVVISGGDGTLDEAVSAMRKAEIDIPVGLIPTGSTNDFANSLRIPKDPVKAAEIAANGKPVPVDIGTFNSATFVYVAAFGLFTDVAYKTDQGMKNVFGHFAYLMEAGKRVFKIPKHKLRANLDGTKVEGIYSYGMITNAHSVGGVKNITGNLVDMSDGLFEVTLVRHPKNPIELSEIFTALLTEKGKSRLVETYKASEISVQSEEELSWTLDG